MQAILDKIGSIVVTLIIQNIDSIHQFLCSTWSTLQNYFQTVSFKSFLSPSNYMTRIRLFPLNIVKPQLVLKVCNNCKMSQTERSISVVHWMPALEAIACLIANVLPPHDWKCARLRTIEGNVFELTRPNPAFIISNLPVMDVKSFPRLVPLQQQNESK